MGSRSSDITEVLMNNHPALIYAAVLTRLTQHTHRLRFGTYAPSWNHFKKHHHDCQRKLSDKLIEQARRCAQVQHRSTPKQIAYWSQIGKIAKKNPDLPFFMICDLLVADREAVLGEYVFS